MSHRVYQGIPRLLGQGQAQRFYAEVTAPAPGSQTAPMYIVIPDYSTDHSFTVTGPWPVIYGGTLPRVGDPVMIEMDNRGNARCTWWGGTFTPFTPIVDPD